MIPGQVAWLENYSYLINIEQLIEHCSINIEQSRSTLCGPMDCIRSGFPVLHYLLQLAQTQVHRVSDAIKPSHFLSHPSPAFYLFQHQSLFH